MSTLAKAIATAMTYHATQVDKSGHPFVGHPLRVLGYAALETQDEEVLCAAVMHDILEDTPCTAQDLEALGFSETVVHLVLTLTRSDSETYVQYIERIPLGGHDAVLVKLADIRDNLDDRRGEFTGRESIDARHVKARVRLLEPNDG